eukprot:574968-Prymnesium_polylepis.1
MHMNVVCSVEQSLGQRRESPRAGRRAGADAKRQTGSSNRAHNDMGRRLVGMADRARWVTLMPMTCTHDMT